MAETKDPIDNLSYVADEAKNVMDPDIESAANSSIKPPQSDPDLEKRLMRKIDIWRK